MIRDESEMAQKLLEENLGGLSELKDRYSIESLPRGIHVNFSHDNFSIILKWFKSEGQVHRKIIVEGEKNLKGDRVLPTLINKDHRYDGPEDMVGSVITYLMASFLLDLYSEKS